METFVAIVHIVFAILLVGLVLIQDSKSGSLGMSFGGGGSNSVLGATGATSFVQKFTRWVAALFAVTSISLTYFASTQHKSILDGALPEVSAPMIPAEVPAVEPAAGEAPAANQ